MSPHPEYHSLRIAGRKIQHKIYNSCWKKRMQTPSIHCDPLSLQFGCNEVYFYLKTYFLFFYSWVDSTKFGAETNFTQNCYSKFHKQLQRNNFLVLFLFTNRITGISAYQKPQMPFRSALSTKELVQHNKKIALSTKCGFMFLNNIFVILLLSLNVSTLTWKGVLP